MSEVEFIVLRATNANNAVTQATQQRDAALSDRKQAIKELHSAGLTMDEIAKTLGLSRSRVGLILNDNRVLKPGSRPRR